ncbi:hypothetical protein WDV06_15205 [Streptomyces racemochromogenes]|uniref:Beta/gamma crystallin 'Greek key' domain-containing protein n=1 Tax=Streptomyces racemochromogenes TaxID=67353 RepID=A0ABW7PDI8_9ACTN
MYADEVIFYDGDNYTGKSVTLRAGEQRNVSSSELGPVRSVKVGDGVVAEVWGARVGDKDQGIAFFTTDTPNVRNTKTVGLRAADVHAMAVLIRYRDTTLRDGETGKLAFSDVRSPYWKEEIPAAADVYHRLEVLKSEIHTSRRANLVAKDTKPAPVTPEQDNDPFSLNIPGGIQVVVDDFGLDEEDPGQIAFSYDTRNRTVVLDRFEPLDKTLSITQDGPGMFTITRTG